MFKIHRDVKRIYLEGGMSPEICLVKYLARRTGRVYGGWKPTTIFGTGNVVHETIRNIVTEIRNSTTKERSCVISPGVLSIPYVVELTDSMYLPSQLLISVRSMKELEEVLDCAKKSGIKCYAEVGYDGCMPSSLVAWIKFLELPELYLSLLEDLGVRTLVTIGVNRIGYATPGENLARLYSEKKRVAREGMIALLYIGVGYGMNRKEEEKLFSEKVKDFNPKLVRHRLKCIQDWESGTIDPERLLSNWFGTKHIIYTKGTMEIYDLSWYLTLEFTKLNGIPVKGTVLNPYFVNNPLYEAYYGYISYSYWQQNPNAHAHYKDLLKGLDIDSPELWVNAVPGTEKLIAKFDPELITTKIKMSNLHSDELSDWILSHRPLSYDGIKYISFSTLNRICNHLGMEVSTKKDHSKFEAARRHNLSFLKQPDCSCVGFRHFGCRCKKKS